jgi:hypothetical protein
MAGGWANRTRRAGPALGLAVLWLASGVTARAQDPSPPRTPAAIFADVVAPEGPPAAMPGPSTGPRPWSESGTRVETGVLDTITGSILAIP